MCKKANTMSKAIVNISDRVKQHLQQANTEYKKHADQK